MKKLLFLLFLASLSSAFFTSCNKEDDFDENMYDIPNSVRMYWDGPLLHVQLHDEQGTDLVEKHRYVKYPFNGSEEYVDGFSFKYYLDGKLIEVKDTSLVAFKSENRDEGIQRPEYWAVPIGSEEVYKLTLGNTRGTYDIKIEMSNKLLFPSSDIHTLTYRFTRIRRPQSQYQYKGDPDNVGNLMPVYSDVKFDGQPLDVMEDQSLAKKRIDIIAK